MKTSKNLFKNHKTRLVTAITLGVLSASAIFGLSTALIIKKTNKSIEPDSVEETAITATTIPSSIQLWKEDDNVTTHLTTASSTNYDYEMTFHIEMDKSDIRNGSNDLEPTANIWLDVSLEDEDNSLIYLNSPNTWKSNGNEYETNVSVIVGDKNGSSTSGFYGDGVQINHTGSYSTVTTTAKIVEGLDVERLYQTNTPVLYIYDANTPAFNGCPSSMDGCQLGGSVPTQDATGQAYYIGDGNGNGNQQNTALNWSFANATASVTDIVNITDSSAKIYYDYDAAVNDTIPSNGDDFNGQKSTFGTRTPGVVQYRIYNTTTGVDVIPYSSSTIINPTGNLINVSGLAAGTYYTIEFRVDYKYVIPVTADNNFKTTGASINASTNDGLVTNITKNSATISYVMSMETTQPVTVEYRYAYDADKNGVVDSNEWTTNGSTWVDTGHNEVNGGVYSFNLSGLKSDSYYEVQVRDSSTDANITVAHFRTLADAPTVSNLNVTSSTPTSNGNVSTMTISYDVYQGSFDTETDVEYRVYRTATGPATSQWLKTTPTEIGSAGSTKTYSFDINSTTDSVPSTLRSNTSYTIEVRPVSTEDTVSQTATVTHTTSVAGNKILSSSAIDYTQNTATIMYYYDYVDQLNQTVEYRYGIDDNKNGTLDTSEVDSDWRVDGHGAWTGDGYSNIYLTGLTSGSQYAYEVRIKENPSAISKGTFTTAYKGSTVALSGSLTATSTTVTANYDVTMNDYQNAKVEYRLYETAYPPVNQQTGWVTADTHTSADTTGTVVATKDTVTNTNIKSNTQYSFELRVSNVDAGGATISPYIYTSATTVITSAVAPAFGAVTVTSVPGEYNKATVNYSINLNSYSAVTVEYRVREEGSGAAGWSTWAQDSNGTITSSGNYSFNIYGTSNTSYDVELRIRYENGVIVPGAGASATGSTGLWTSEVSGLQILRTNATGVEFEYLYSQHDTSAATNDVEYKIYNTSTSSESATSWISLTPTEVDGTVTNIESTNLANNNGDSTLETIQNGQEYKIELRTKSSPNNILTTTFVAEDEANISNLRTVSTTETSATLSFDLTNATSSSMLVDYEYQVVAEGQTTGSWAYDSVTVGAGDTVPVTVTVGTGGAAPFNQPLVSDTKYIFEVYVTDSMMTNDNNVTTFTTDTNYGAITNQTAVVGNFDSGTASNDIKVTYDLNLDDSENLVYYSINYVPANGIDSAQWFLHTGSQQGANTLYIYNLAAGTYTVSLWLEDGGDTRGDGIVQTTSVTIV